MEKISKNKMVKMHYTLKDVDGNILDSSLAFEPFEYLHGNGNLIPGLENALEGKSAGDKFEATVLPKDAYGEYDENMIVEVPRSQFDEDIEITVGMKFNASTAGGPMQVSVVNVTDETVTVDGNHEFAGKTLVFTIEVVSVRQATESELTPMPRGCSSCAGCGTSSCGCGSGTGCCGGSCGGGCSGSCS